MEATVFTGWIYDHLLPHAAIEIQAKVLTRKMTVFEQQWEA
jgi:hypothetical protein